jgi:hypothetical protein
MTQSQLSRLRRYEAPGAWMEIEMAAPLDFSAALRVGLAEVVAALCIGCSVILPSLMIGIDQSIVLRPKRRCGIASLIIKAATSYGTREPTRPLLPSVHRPGPRRGRELAGGIQARGSAKPKRVSAATVASSSRSA